jgi:predicted O-methyltransferase YrrM
MFYPGSRARLYAGLLLTFLAVFIPSAVVAVQAPWLAVSVGAASTTSIVVWMLYRWRSKISTYDCELQELRALTALAPLTQGAFVPLSVWSMEPQALLGIINTIYSNNLDTVVEFGTGLSTIVIGQAFKQRGRGRLISFEENCAWHDTILRQLELNGLHDHVTLVNAPLQPYSNAEINVKWYDTSIVKSALRLVSRIDLLLVDGPVSISDWSRYPALPVLEPWLDDKSIVVLDDVNRAMETLVLARWQREYSLLIEFSSSTRKGQALLRRLAPIGQNGSDEQTAAKLFKA